MAKKKREYKEFGVRIHLSFYVKAIKGENVRIRAEKVLDAIMPMIDRKFPKLNINGNVEEVWDDVWGNEF